MTEPHIILIPGIVHTAGKFRPDIRFGEHDGTRMRWRRLTAPERFSAADQALMAAQLAADRTAKRHPDKQIIVRSGP